MSLIEMLEHRAASGQALCLSVVRAEKSVLDLGAAELWTRARARAAGLFAQGLHTGDRLLLLLPNGLPFVETFLGALLAGVVPVIYPPPHTARHLPRYLKQLGRILAQCQPSAIVLDELMLEQAGDFPIQGARLLPAPPTDAPEAPVVRPAASDLAVIQYSSGSTGDPKGVALSHAAILANAHAVGRAIASTPEDTMLSWLPLCHDMGLFGGLIFPLVHGWHAVHLQPHHFLIDPAVWLQAMSRFRATLTIAPNFAYNLCAQTIEEEQMRGVDLSALRVAFNGAEPISRPAVEHFLRRFEPHGFRRTSLFCVYGMAENTLAVTFPPVTRGPWFDHIDREALETEGRAVPVAAGASRPASELYSVKDVASVGRAVEGTEIRVVDEKGEPVAERIEGEICVSGTSLLREYWNNPNANARCLRDGWLFTGDRGYQARGELYVTGRARDLIIRAGRNLHPQDIESVAAEVAGVRRGCVVAVGVRDEADSTEEIWVLAETRATEGAELRELRAAIREAVLEAFGMAPDKVILLEPRALPKTSSGKLQRSLALKLFLEGELQPLSA